jgi:uncharacterized repeat protein (TIGR03803 family)
MRIHSKLFVCFSLVLFSNYAVSQTRLWGLTSTGGTNGEGTIGYYEPASNRWVTEHNFSSAGGANPKGSLALFAGKLYGMTTKGGANDKGVIFEFDPTTKVYTKKIDFNGENGSTPSGSLTLFNDKFYGMTYQGGEGYGVAFEWNPVTNIFEKKISWEPRYGKGAQPRGSLLLDNGMLYGMTSSGAGYDEAFWNGVAFKWNPATNVVQSSQFRFSFVGRNPEGSFVKLGSKFYALTKSGGVNYSGSLIEWDGASSVSNKISLNGAYPTGSLIAVDSKLYGLAAGFGTSAGYVFSWDPATNALQILANFDGDNGRSPFGSLSYSNGKLFGLTYAGGANNLGTLFEFNLTTNVLEKKVDFNNTTGGNPYYTQLLEVAPEPISQTINFEALSSKTYGDAEFSLLATASSGLPVSYESSDPSVAIILGEKVTLLKAGTTIITASQAGNSYYSAATRVQHLLTVSKLTPTLQWSNPADIIYGTSLTWKQLNCAPSSPGTLVYTPPLATTLNVGNNQPLSVTFNPSDPANVNSVSLQVSINVLSPTPSDESLVQTKLWGVTSTGGANDGGTIGYYGVTSGTWTTVHNFESTTGLTPKGSITLYKGKLYGMTSSGGSSNKGVIFEYDPISKIYTKKIDFIGANGSNPTGSLTLLNDKFYGMTFSGGSSPYGTLFEWNPSTNDFAVKVNFNGANGAWPYGSLIVDNGLLLGLTSGGITYDQAFWYGAAFNWNPQSGEYRYKNIQGSVLESNAKYPKGTLVKFGTKFFSVGSNGLFEWTGSFEANSISGIPLNNGLYLPVGSLVLAANSFFGMTENGTIFEFDPNNGIVNACRTLDDSDGKAPKGTLTYSNGKLYGLTNSGGTSDLGTLFEYDITSKTIVKKVDLNYSTGGNPLYTQLLEIAPSPIDQTIQFDALANKTFGDESFTLSASSSAGLPVSFASSDPTIASISSDTVNILKAGMVTITASQPGNSLYNPAIDVSRSLTILKNTPIISWANPIDINIGTALNDVQLNASATCEGTFTYTPSAGSVLSAGNSQVLSVTFNPTNNSDYNVATKQVFINVIDFRQNTNAQLIGFTNAGGTANNGTIFRSSSEGNNQQVLFNFDGINGKNPVGKPLLASNGKYYGLTKNGGLNDSGILFEYNPSNGNFFKIADMSSIGGKNPNGTLIQSSLNGKIYGTCQYGGIQSGLGFGILFEFDPATSQLIKKIELNATSYYAARNPSGSLIEKPSGKIIGVGLNSLYEYDIVGSTYETLLTMGNDLLDTGAPRPPKDPNPLVILGSDGFIYGSTTTGGAGATSQLQRGTLFKVAPDGGLTFFFSFYGSVLNGKPNSGVVELNGKLYGTTIGGGTDNSGELFEFDLSTNSMTKRADFISATTGSNSSGLSIVNGKLYGMTSQGGTNGHGTIFEFDPVSGILTKTHDFNGIDGQPGLNNQVFYQTTPKKSQSITFSALNQKKYRDSPYSLIASASSGLTVGFSSSDQSVATISGNIVTILNAGLTIITATQNGNTEYDAAPSVSQTLIVDKLDPSISWTNPADIVYGTALSSTELNASTTIAGTFVYTPSIGTQLNVGSQTLSVTFTPTDAVNYNSTNREVTVNVAKASQQITFSPIPDKTVGDDSFLLSVLTSSGLPISFTTPSDKISIIGNKVTILKSGRVSIFASQAGSVNFMAAERIEQSFCVKPMKPIITMTTLNSPTPILSSNYGSGNQWYLEEEIILGAVNQELAAQETGAYKVQVKVDDCVSEFSESKSSVVTGDIAIADYEVSVFPNPAEDLLIVKSKAREIDQIRISDLAGKEIDSKQIRSNEFELDVSNYATGIYILKVQSGKVITVSKFAKK